MMHDQSMELVEGSGVPTQGGLKDGADLFVAFATAQHAQAFTQAAKNGARSAYLEVRPSNKSAIALYRRLGFRLIGKKPEYYTDTLEDALVLMKNLKEDL